MKKRKINEKKRHDKSFKKRRERGKNEIFFASLYRDVPNESYQFLIPFAQRISGPDRMDRNRSLVKKQSFFDKQKGAAAEKSAAAPRLTGQADGVYFNLKATSISSISLGEIMTSGPMSRAAMTALAL